MLFLHNVSHMLNDLSPESCARREKSHFFKSNSLRCSLRNANGNNNINVPVTSCAGKLNLNLSSFTTQANDEIVANDNDNDDDDKKLIFFYKSVCHHMLNDMKQSLVSTCPNESNVFAQ